MCLSHIWHSGVQRKQQVEALGCPHLPDDDAARPHPQRLLDQVPQPHLAGTFQTGLPGLERHPIGMREAQHKTVTTTY